MLDDEIEVGEVGRRDIDVADGEGILVERDDRRPLMDVQVLDAKLDASLQVAFGPGVGQFPAARFAAPFGGVELGARDLVGVDQLLEVVEAGLAVTWVPRAVQDEAVGVCLFDEGVPFGGVEAFLIEIRQIGRLQDRHVVVTLDEKIVVHGVRRILVELLLRPHFLRRAQRVVIAVEAVDELLAVHVLLIGRAAIPKVGVAVDDENFLALVGLVHLSPPCVASGFCAVRIGFTPPVIARSG